MSTLFIEAPPTRFNVAAFSRPARTFTGDFYFTHREGDRLWFALGDVAGKGARAAVIMAMIQEELEHRIVSCAATRCDPAVTMQRLHLVLKPLMPINRFVTIVIGHLRDDGTLTVANAGHCPPLIVRKGSVETIAPTGPVAGMLDRSLWRSVTRHLDPGDAIILYSDGLLEARSADGEEFGIERIAGAVRTASHDRIIGNVLNDARCHAFEDDVTMLAITAA
jgi:sigma-B regulation protein RsbU (phosphoserine phosphatase)